MLAHGPVESIVQAMQPHRTLVLRTLREAGEAARIMRDMKEVVSAESTGDGEVRIDYSGDHEAQADMLARLIHQGVRVVSLKEDQADLEDVFLKLTTGAVN
jgi:ABC-2 type transport system ATP-binding protein